MYVGEEGTGVSVGIVDIRKLFQVGSAGSAPGFRLRVWTNCCLASPASSVCKH